MHRSDDQGHGLEKIRSQALRREALSDGGPTVVVVVEVDLPHATIDVVPPGTGEVSGASGYRFLASEPDPEQVDRRVNDARAGIQSITGKRPETYLASSGTFVIEANGEQIRHIAELPSVAAIWANSGF